MATPSVFTPPQSTPTGPLLGSAQLVRALRDEHNVLEDLVATLDRQRKAVATDNIDAVNDSVFVAHRLLGAYREARSRRRSAIILACGGGEGSVEDLPRALGVRMTDDERHASDALRDAARRLVDAVDLNRRLLHAAMSNGDSFLKVLTGAAQQMPQAYPAGNRPALPVGRRLVDLRG
ncbi:MAG: flagellar export chaperone FlgN [Gemmatimonadaceae bacterium]